MFSRLRCHFCGAKTPHNKTTTQFQCSACEAINYLDGKGNIVDTPASVAAPPQAGPTTSNLFSTFTRPTSESLEHQEKQAFCRTCVQNQHLYNQNLANYLPEEDHPRYAEFEAAIPTYKEELEKRYPLICKSCAPKVQTVINRADHYGLTQSAAKLVADTRARGGRSASGRRDDGGKKFARFVLNSAGTVLYLGLAVQIAYHVYGMLAAMSAQTGEDVVFDDDLVNPSPSRCMYQAGSFLFTRPCFEILSTIIPKTLALAVAGLIYNPGRKAWYDPTYRMEAVNGQWNYFYMQLMILAVRYLAWIGLSHPSTAAGPNSQQLAAAHGFIIVFIILLQSTANRGIKPVHWKLKGKMMPKPADEDVLGAIAAPASEHFTPRASEKDPYRYLHGGAETPLNLSNFAPKSARPTSQQNYTRGSYLTLQQPSPDYSEDEDYDRMEMDDAPVMRSSQRLLDAIPRPNLQPSHSLPSTTTAASSSTTTALPQPTNPFYTRIPPAPLSMEHRLRNPPYRPTEPVAIPLSQQKDFLKRMGENVRPVEFASKKRTEFELKPSGWVLPGDVKETGLEDRFQATFRLDEAEPGGGGRSAKKGFLSMLGL